MDLERIARKLCASGAVRTAGTIEFVKDQGPVRRDVRVKGYKWSSDALRDLAKILWASQRAHSYAMAALRIFSKMPSSEFSPDGLLGGRGYIQSVKDMRSGLANTVELMSSFTDTVHDEINAEHWSSVEDKADIQGLVDDAAEVKSNPEGFVEGEFEEEGEAEPLVNPVAENPVVEGQSEDDEDDEAQEQPGSQMPPDYPRVSSGVDYDRYAVAFDKMIRHKRVASRQAGGALDELPFQGGEPLITEVDLPGPRAYKIGPAVNPDLDVEAQILDGAAPQNPCDEQELLINNGLALPDQAYPTDGDDYRLSFAANPESYSWLPGADNDKPMPWYGLGITDADTKWMEENCRPNMPPGILPEALEPDMVSLWDGVKS
jgi:hypothetical protein